MTNEAQQRHAQLEAEIIRLTDAANNQILTRGERAQASRDLRKAITERDDLEHEEARHWLNQQTTTKSRVVTGQIHKALAPKVMRKS